MVPVVGSWAAVYAVASSRLPAVNSVSSVVLSKCREVRSACVIAPSKPQAARSA
jgi:hypothetical protein